jgi:hypothetical protein
LALVVVGLNVVEFAVVTRSAEHEIR